MRRLITIILLCLILIPARAAAAFDGDAGGGTRYIALGDSIAAYFGLSEEQGYAELLAGKLTAEGGYESVSLVNLAQSGDDTGELLERIENNKDTIAGADIVTICIGGNNFLGTLINGMTAPLNLSPETMLAQSSFLYNMSVSDEMFEIAAQGLQDPLIQARLAEGIARFRADLPVIIKNVRDLAPDAEIYFMTVYNPLEPEHPVYPLLDPVTNQINAMIKDADDITVVDIYAAYSEYDGSGIKDKLSQGGIDPHPSAAGQRLIANEHFKAITGTESADIIDITPASAEKPEEPAAAENPAPETETQNAPDDMSEAEEQAAETAESADGIQALRAVIVITAGAAAFTSVLFIIIKSRKR